MLRRRFRFSLKFLLLVLTGVAIYVGLQASRVAKQRKAHAIIQSLGCRVGYEHEYDGIKRLHTSPDNLRTPGPAWVHSLIGEDYFRTVVSLSLSKSSVSDDDLKRLSQLLPHIRVVALQETRITDEGLRHLQNFGQLQKRSLSKSNVRDSGLRHVGQCTQLRSLQLTDTQVTDDGVKQLSRLSSLATIGLSGTAVTDKAIEYLTKASPIELRWVNLGGTYTTDAIIEPLTSLPSLDFLNVQNTYVTVDGASAIRKAFPGSHVSQSVGDVEIGDLNNRAYPD